MLLSKVLPVAPVPQNWYYCVKKLVNAHIFPKFFLNADVILFASGKSSFSDNGIFWTPVVNVVLYHQLKSKISESGIADKGGKSETINHSRISKFTNTLPFEVKNCGYCTELFVVEKCR